jgi:hypothetical protein
VPFIEPLHPVEVAKLAGFAASGFSLFWLHPVRCGQPVVKLEAFLARR